MKRTGFKRQQYVTPPPVPPRALIRRGVVAPITDEAHPLPKSNLVIHAAYRELVRQLPCARCGHPPPSQFCHADEGKGMGLKTDDRRGWAGCGPHDGHRGCHDLIGSSGHYPRERRRLLEQIYASWTREQIRDSGLWPIDLPPLDEGEN